MYTSIYLAFPQVRSLQAWGCYPWSHPPALPASPPGPPSPSEEMTCSLQPALSASQQACMPRGEKLCEKPMHREDGLLCDVVCGPPIDN